MQQSSSNGEKLFIRDDQSTFAHHEIAENEKKSFLSFSFFDKKK